MWNPLVEKCVSWEKSPQLFLFFLWLLVIDDKTKSSLVLVLCLEVSRKSKKCMQIVLIILVSTHTVRKSQIVSKKFNFPEKLWKCYGFAIFCCLQLWFHEKKVESTNINFWTWNWVLQQCVLRKKRKTSNQRKRNETCKKPKINLPLARNCTLA